MDNTHVYIRTFGYFDVFVDGKPIAFRNKKSKELFALLVDRRGGYVSSEEYSQLFKGSYMSNYSWGEITLGELLSERKL